MKIKSIEPFLFANPFGFLAKLLIYEMIENICFKSRILSSNLSSYGMHINKKCTRIFFAVFLPISDKLPY